MPVYCSSDILGLHNVVLTELYSAATPGNGGERAGQAFPGVPLLEGEDLCSFSKPVSPEPFCTALLRSHGDPPWQIRLLRILFHGLADALPSLVEDPGSRSALFTRKPADGSSARFLDQDCSLLAFPSFHPQEGLVWPLHCRGGWRQHWQPYGG